MCVESWAGVFFIGGVATQGWYQRHRERILTRAREKRAAIKAAGGLTWEQLNRKERAARALFRKRHPEAIKAERRARELRGRSLPYKTWLCRQARARGRKRGLEATITSADLHWPTHCPVLGIALDYPARSGERKDRIVAANWPSLDRWDSAKGYVPGNVFVISYRANTLKNNATLGELLKIAEYLRAPPAVR